MRRIECRYVSNTLITMKYFDLFIDARLRSYMHYCEKVMRNEAELEY